MDSETKGMVGREVGEWVKNVKGNINNTVISFHGDG